jgi:hypothetical protein|nr:MAG TPA: Protein of unknown function (DUF1018) [Caudoviricetes sp.]
MATKIFDHDRLSKQLIKKFHVLLGQQGLGQEAKEGILAGYGVEHTNELTLQQLQQVCSSLEGNRRMDDAKTDDKRVDMDKWRKRAIAAAFGLASELGYAVTMDGAKAMILRATGNEYTSFNKIPQTRLQAIYYGFRRNVKDMNSTVRLAEEMLIEINRKNTHN